MQRYQTAGIALRYPRTLTIAAIAISASEKQASITSRPATITPLGEDLLVQIM